MSQSALSTGRDAPWPGGRGGGRTSRLRSALAAIALLGAALVPLALAATVAPASADTFNVQPVPGTLALASVACPTATTCIAVGSGTGPTGNTGAVVPISNGVPGAPQLVTGTSGLTGVACSGPTTCVAVGSGTSQSPVVVPIVNGVVGTVQTVPASGGTLSGVACYNATSCVAVGLLSRQGLVVPITNGVAGTPQLIASIRSGLTAVSCYSATACVAVGSTRVFPQPATGVEVLITNGTGGAAQAVPGTTNLTAIACRVSVCEATGVLTSGQPGVVPFVDGVPGTPQAASATISGLAGIACATDTLCEAVGNAPGGDTGIGAVVPVLSGTPADPVLVPGTNQLLGIACPTAVTCIAVGSNSEVVNSTTVFQGVVVNISIVTRTVTGDFTGPLTVNAGESVVITNARVVGPVTVNPGGALTVVNSQISRGIVANAPSFFSVCGSQVAAPSTTPIQGIVVSNAAVPITIGDPANGCAGNRVAGDVSLTGNTAGLTLGANIVSGNVTVNNNTVGTDLVKANNVFKALACAGNTPPPTNAGQTNTAGSKSGQCSAL